jgi:hypothetical protein
MKKAINTLLIFSFLIVFNTIIFAQPGDDDGQDGIEGEDPITAPINTNLSLLFIGGLVVALYAFSGNKNKKESTNSESLIKFRGKK